MLYERWRTIADQYSDRPALRSLGEDRAWSFGELAAEVESLPPTDDEVAFPTGGESSFITETLRAWRDGRILCPLETGQSPPHIAGLPAGIRHIKSSSGTTGTPHLIAFTEEQMAADAENIIATMGLTADSPNLGVISLAHSYGFSNLALPLALHGIPLVLAPAPLPETVRAALLTGDNWTLPAVPALWQTWRDTGVIAGNIRTAISAGAPLPIELERSVFRECGLKIHNFLGSSECGGIAYDRTDAPRDDAAEVGTAMENVHVSTTEDDRLRVASRAVASTYWPDPDPQLADGVFLLGDLAEIRDGEIRLLGRAGDRINVAGRKVAPESIERALLAHPDVKACLVFGIPSASTERNEEIVAVVTGGEEMKEELRQHLAHALPAWQTPRHWSFVPELKTNARGKLPRAEWRRRYLDSRTNETG